MVPADLIFLQGMGEGVATERYATKYAAPELSPDQGISTEVTMNDAGNYEFTITRDLAPKGENKFAIELDKEFPFMWAELTTTAELEYHDDRAALKMTLFSVQPTITTTHGQSVLITYSSDDQKMLI